jgi:hypothetical protein
VDLSHLWAIDSAAVSALLIAHLRELDDRRQMLLIRGPLSMQEALDRLGAPVSYLPALPHTLIG